MCKLHPEPKFCLGWTNTHGLGGSNSIEMTHFTTVKITHFSSLTANSQPRVVAQRRDDFSPLPELLANPLRSSTFGA